MRVLLIFPMADLQTGSAIKWAFEQLGHTVQTVDAKLYPGRTYRAALEFKPDLIFCSRTKELTNNIAWIRSDPTLNPKIAMWNVDVRSGIDSWQHLFPLIRLCDYHFVIDSRLIPEWKEINPNTFWLPQGLQNELYKKPLSITDEDRERYSCDVSWAGDIDSGGHTFRKPFIEAVDRMGINFKVWGCRGNPKVYNEEHNKMVSLSKINLGISGWPENEDCVSVRDYKILGSGGFLLELYREKLFELLPVVFTDCYGHPNDLVRVIRHYLTEEPELRKKMAKRACEWVHNFATYTHRIRKAWEIMGTSC